MKGGLDEMKKEYVVEINNLSKDFKGKQVIKNCNMSVRKGSIYCLVGQNGAGKTTIFKILLGLISTFQGSAIVLGMDSKKNSLGILAKTGSVIENAVFYEHLSAAQNLKIYLEYMGIDDINRIEQVFEKVGIKDSADQLVSTFSLGMRQRLAIARALVHEPDLLILDEPINGMDPVGIREMRDLFHKLSKQGVTILMSSHILSEVELIADDIGFLVGGTIVKEMQSQDILNQHSGGLENYFMKIIHEGID